jgi:protein O-mannosyl-transferase
MFDEGAVTIKKPVLAAILIIIAACWAFYGNTLFNGFVYDDQAQVLQNPWIRDFRSIPTVFASEVWGFQGAGVSNYYRPLLHVIYLVCYQLFGVQPWGYHAVNVLFHCGVCVMVFLLALRLLQDAPARPRLYASLAAALLFAAHPVHTDAVAPVMSVTDPALALFLLLSLSLHIRCRDLGRTFSPAAALFFFLAALCKESALLFPLIILGYDLLLAKWDGVRRGALRYLPFLVAVVGYFALRLNAIGAFVPVNAHPDLSLWQCLFNALPLFAQYLWKLLLPYPLNAKYEFHPVTSLVDPALIASALATLAYGAAFLFALKKNRVVAFGLLFMVAPLLPTLYIRAIPYPFAERYLYLPSAGCALLVAFLGVRLAGKGRALAALAAVVFVCYGVGTVSRNGVWHDNYTLWSDTVPKSPGDPVAHNNLGTELKARGRVPEAIEQYQASLRLKPDATVYRNLGSAYADTGQREEAVRQYQAALRLEPNNAAAHNSLGAIYGEMGLAGQAMEQFADAVRFDPRNAEAHYNLGMACRDRGLVDLALQEFSRAVALAPDDAGFRGALEETRGAGSRQ